MTNRLELSLVNRAAEVSRVQDSLEQIAQAHAIPDRKLHEVQLALEEHLTNIVRYGYQDDAEHQIKVHDPEIWLTGMKPGEESRILKQVLRAAPDKNIQMLSRGTVLTV